MKLAKELQVLIESKCTDEIGYLEAFTKDFQPESNEKLSENGVLAEKTMNTLLHVFEAYTEFYRVSHDEEVGERLKWIMDVFADKVYNPKLKRQEVFFDKNYNTIIDLYSYGHDIETAWLMDRGVEVLGDAHYKEKMSPITETLAENVYKVAFDGHSLANECCKGEVNDHRVWWVQAETVIGFLNEYQKHPQKENFLEASEAEWEFIKEHVIDKRTGSEWFWEVHPDGSPIADRPIVEPWTSSASASSAVSHCLFHIAILAASIHPHGGAHAPVEALLPHYHRLSQAERERAERLAAEAAAKA